MLGIRWREFITYLGGAAAWPMAGHGQQRERMRRIGVLIGFAKNDPLPHRRLGGSLPFELEVPDQSRSANGRQRPMRRVNAVPRPAQSLTKLTGLLAALLVAAHAGAADPQSWRQEWPTTDFTRHTVALSDIRSGGPSKDGIPAIDSPRFEQLNAGRAGGWARSIADNEPVISVAIAGDARAYPVTVLIWHEIVNDSVGDMPVVVTYCPLCNSGLVFERSQPDRLLDFGTTGKLRNSDLVMYDRQTESWWQQFTGEAIVGALSGRKLRQVPSRMESMLQFRQRFPHGKVLVPTNPNARNYGENPYVGYDASGRRPFLYDGSMPEGIDPMERVVAVETAPGYHEAWSLALLRREGRIQSNDLFLTWEAGQASALDSRAIPAGRDVGGVVVQRQIDGILVDVPYDVTFAFAFHAFRGGSPIHRAKPAATPK